MHNSCHSQEHPRLVQMGHSWYARESCTYNRGIMCESTNLGHADLLEGEPPAASQNRWWVDECYCGMHPPDKRTPTHTRTHKQETQCTSSRNIAVILSKEYLTTCRTDHMQTWEAILFLILQTRDRASYSWNTRQTLIRSITSLAS